MLYECMHTQAQALVNTHISYKLSTPVKQIRNQTTNFLGSGASETL